VSHLTLETLVAVAASALMALMVAAGASMIVGPPTDIGIESEAPMADGIDPLTICRDEAEQIVCVRADT